MPAQRAALNRPANVGAAADRADLDRQKRDAYVRQRKEDGSGFVSRSAYKLVQLAQKYPLFRPGRVIVDLGAAPGGWSQAVLQACPETRLFALDRLPLDAPLPEVPFLQGDFTEGTVQEALRSLVTQHTKDAAPVDVVLSDMMGTCALADQRTPRATPSVTPRRPSICASPHSYVCALTQEFCEAMLRKTPEATLRPTPSTPVAALPSAFVCKYFMSADADAFRHDVLTKKFRSVRSEKMQASRSGSREQYWVCLGYRG